MERALAVNAAIGAESCPDVAVPEAAAIEAAAALIPRTNTEIASASFMLAPPRGSILVSRWVRASRRYGFAPLSLAHIIGNAEFQGAEFRGKADFNSVKISDNLCYNSGTNTLQFYNTGEKTLNGETTLKLVGELFQPKSDFKKIKDNLSQLVVQVWRHFSNDHTWYNSRSI